MTDTNPPNRSELWQTSTATFWRDSVTGQVFDLQPDEEYPELPGDAVRLVPQTEVEAWRERCEEARGWAKAASEDAKQARADRDAAKDAYAIAADQLHQRDAELTRLREHAIQLPSAAELKIRELLRSLPGGLDGHDTNRAVKIMELLESWRTSTPDVTRNADDVNSGAENVRHWTEGGWEPLAIAARQFSSAFWNGAEADHLGSLAQALRDKIDATVRTGTPPEVDVFLTTQKAAELLHISRPTLVKLLEDGKIPFSRPAGRSRRVLRSDVLAYAESAKVARREALAALSYESARDGTDEESNRFIETRPATHPTPQVAPVTGSQPPMKKRFDEMKKRFDEWSAAFPELAVPVAPGVLGVDQPNPPANDEKPMLHNLPPGYAPRRASESTFLLTEDEEAVSEDDGRPASETSEPRKEEQ